MTTLTEVKRPALRTTLPAHGADEIAQALNLLLADLFALYVKTKNFHWHVTGPHFRDYHLLLDDQAAQVLATIDPVAERVRKIGRPTLRSIGQIARLQRTPDSEAEALGAEAMLEALIADNAELIANLREAHELCDQYGDIATASLIENWVDEAEQRVWFLSETRGA
jgi:starvation-inducible DNA-binding protein